MMRTISRGSLPLRILMRIDRCCKERVHSETGPLVLPGQEAEDLRIIISPAKKMVVDTDTFTCKEVPCFMEKTQILKDWICSLPYAEQKALWKCNDKIVQQNAERFAQMDLYRNLTPAILAYDGIQYTYMAPAVFEDGQYAYVQDHLRILSGFYGVVKPMEGVVPYRLEMQAKAAVNGTRSLYEF